MRTTRALGILLGLALLVAATSATAGVNCCNCVGCPTGASACLTVPNEVDVCGQLGCSGISSTCLPGACTAGREEICPADEAGQCDDGVDNDVNGQIDCADAACATSLACLPTPAPMLGPVALASLLAALAAAEFWRRRRAPARPRA